MPLKKVLGDRLPVGSVGSRQVPANPTSKAVDPPLEEDRWCRNGLHPNAQFVNLLNGAVNAAVCYRTKEYFASGGLAQSPLTSGGGGDRIRWRFAMRTGPYTHSLMALAVMIPQSSSYGSNAYTRLDLATNSTGSPAVVSETFTFGAWPQQTSGANYTDWKPILKFVETGVDPSTDYYGTVTDVDNGRIQSLVVFELQSMTENTSGYLGANHAAMSPILDVTRQNQATILRACWRDAGAKVLWWGVDQNALPLTTASTTAKNVVDDTSTAVSASTPGYTLVMTNKDRLSQTTGVPVVMKAFGSVTGVPANGGRATLKDSAGNTVLQIANAWATGTFGWQSVSGVIPASVAKYDLHYDCGTAGSTFNLYAVSIYEVE